MRIIIEEITLDEARMLFQPGSAGGEMRLASAGGDAMQEDPAGVENEVQEFYRGFQRARERATEEARGIFSRETGGRVRTETRQLLEAMVADGYTLVDPAGNLLERGDMLRDITSMRTEFQTAERSEESTRTFGSTALYTCVLTMNGELDGQRFVGRFRDVETFVRGRGGWQLVSSNLTKLAS